MHVWRQTGELLWRRMLHCADLQTATHRALVTTAHQISLSTLTHGASMIPTWFTDTKGHTISEEEARKRILELDLTCVAWKMHMEAPDGYGWSVDKIRRIEWLYRAFLFDCWKYTDVNNVPSKLVDEYWHNHILFTRKYAKDCDWIFGRYLGHNPDFGAPPATEEFLSAYKA